DASYAHRRETELSREHRWAWLRPLLAASDMGTSWFLDRGLFALSTSVYYLAALAKEEQAAIAAGEHWAWGESLMLNAFDGDDPAPLLGSPLFDGPTR